MRMQVLISTMHQKDFGLLDKMNIQTEAIVINQCDKNDYSEFDYNGHNIKWFSFSERGVGLSRNSALMRADADVLLFADDDVVYEDGYEELILHEFNNNPKASVMVFNLQSLNPDRPEFMDTKKHKLKITNCLKYGACRIAVKREAVIKKNIMYSLLFGGGARYQAGEDNLFLTNCLQAGLKCSASSVKIGIVGQKGSTWFRGYNEKYYMDRGALFCAMYGKKAKFMLFLMALKEFRRKSEFGFFEKLKLGKKGIKSFKKL